MSISELCLDVGKITCCRRQVGIGRYAVIFVDILAPLGSVNAKLPYILESNPHPFYSFRGLKNQMPIRIACGLDSRSRTGFRKNDRAAVRAVRTI